MQPKTLSQYDILVFDVYGTLIDWETGIFNAMQPLLAQAKVKWTREEALVAFNSVEKDLQVQHPEMLYNELLEEVYKAFADRLGVESSPAEAQEFGDSIALWKPHSDTVSALRTLKKYYKLTVLSNVDNHSFSTYTRAQLDPSFETDPIFDLVMTAQDIGSYKPDVANFEYALKMIKERFGIEKERVLVTACSLFHDHKPANILGISSCFIAREGQSDGINSDATYDFKFTTLGEMAAAREAEVGVAGS